MVGRQTQGNNWRSNIYDVIPLKTGVGEHNRRLQRINNMFESVTDRKLPGYCIPSSTVAVVVLVAAACYASLYLSLVQRKPVYYGNRLRQIPLARLNFMAIENGTLENRTLPIGEPISAPADAYHVAYQFNSCLLYTSPSPRDATLSRMPSSA